MKLETDSAEDILRFLDTMSNRLIGNYFCSHAYYNPGHHRYGPTGGSHLHRAQRPSTRITANHKSHTRGGHGYGYPTLEATTEVNRLRRLPKVRWLPQHVLQALLEGSRLQLLVTVPTGIYNNEHYGNGGYNHGGYNNGGSTRRIPAAAVQPRLRQSSTAVIWLRAERHQTGGYAPSAAAELPDRRVMPLSRSRATKLAVLPQQNYVQPAYPEPQQGYQQPHAPQQHRYRRSLTVTEAPATRWSSWRSTGGSTAEATTPRLRCRLPPEELPVRRTQLLLHSGPKYYLLRIQPVQLWLQAFHELRVRLPQPPLQRRLTVTAVTQARRTARSHQPPLLSTA